MGTQGAQSAKAASASGTGTGKLAVAASNVRQNIFRFYNTVTQVHFFTMSASERDYVKANLRSFKDEGMGFFAYPNPDPVLSPVEKDHVIATWPTIFNYEGIAWYASTASAANLMPIYRFFNTKTGAHFYTNSASERDHVLATWNWFTYEGIAYYVGETAADPVVTPVVPPVLPDTTAPVITVLGTNPLNLSAGTAYTEAGATCTDNKDATCTVGTYVITYTATDAAGNVSSKTRVVSVEVVPNTQFVMGNIVCTATAVTVVDTVTCYISPVDPDGIASVSATLDGVSVSLNASYLVSFLDLTSSFGNHTLIFTGIGKKPDGTPESAVTSSQTITVSCPIGTAWDGLDGCG